MTFLLENKIKKKDLPNLGLDDLGLDDLGLDDLGLPRMGKGFFMKQSAFCLPKSQQFLGSVYPILNLAFLGLLFGSHLLVMS